MKESSSWTREGTKWLLMRQLLLATVWSLFAQELNVHNMYLNSQSNPDMIQIYGSVPH